MAVLAIAAFMFAAVGCDVPTDISFTTDNIGLFVGETRDITPYAVFSPATSDERNFSITVDGESVVADGKLIKAVAPGKSTVTAKSSGGSATMTVSVSYRPPRTLTLSHDGELVQTSGETESVEFVAAVDSFADPDISVEWTVNGKRAGGGKTFTFAPRGVGEFEIRAATGALSASETVKVYAFSNSEAHSVGTVVQHRNFTPVRFYVDETVVASNPHSVYEWRVNGEVSSRLPEFVFTPAASGEYNVELYLNGKKREIDGRSSIVVSATGMRAPTPRVEIDERGKVFVCWDDRASVRSVAIVKEGLRSSYESMDLKYSSRFTGGKFDATGLIDVCSANPKTLSVTVTADEVSDSCEFKQYPSEASGFLAETILCRNSFISDIDGIYDFLSECYATGKRECECYLSRECESAKDDVLEAAETAMRLLGVHGDTEIQGSILKTAFGEYSNIPTCSEEPDSSHQMRISVPHLEYETSGQRRNPNYVLNIERAKRSVHVDNTEQLVNALKNGILPEFEKSLQPAKVYGLARTVLMSVIGSDYSDADKVHAVYDWIQICTRRVFDAKEGSSADFAEGVFIDGAASDLGMAKAFVILCGMEGIECDISFGVLRDGYYNRVKIDGLYYCVDVFGGEVEHPASTNECCTHSGLFVACDTPQSGGAYDVQRSYYLAKFYYDGIYYDRYIERWEAANGKIKAAVYGEFSRCVRMSFDIRSQTGKVVFSNTEYGGEFMISPDMTKAERDALERAVVQASVEYVKSAVEELYPKGGDGYESALEKAKNRYAESVNTFVVGNLLCVKADIPIFVSET